MARESRSPGDVPTEFFGDTRLENNSVDLDALAQQAGYDNFADMQAASPELAQQLANSVGGGDAGATTYNQAAIHDPIDKTKMALTIGGVVGGGALADAALGGAFGGAAAGGGGFTGPTLAQAGLANSATGLVPAGTAPVVAGASGGGTSIASLAKALGPALGAMSSARGKGREDQNNANFERDKLLKDEAVANATQGNAAANIDLNQREFQQRAGRTNLSDALRGGLLQGTQDISFGGLSDNITKHMPTVTGGLRPSALVGKDQIGSDLQRQALLNLMHPDQANTGPMSALNVASGMKAPPSSIQFPGMTPQPQPNGLDTFLQYAGPAASMIGSYFGRG